MKAITVFMGAAKTAAENQFANARAKISKLAKGKTKTDREDWETGVPFALRQASRIGTPGTNAGTITTLRPRSCTDCDDETARPREARPLAVSSEA